MCCCKCCHCKKCCSQIWGIFKGGILMLAYGLVAWFLFTYVEENMSPVYCYINSNEIIAKQYRTLHDERKRATLLFQQLQNKTNLNLTEYQATAVYSTFQKHFNVPASSSLPPDAITLCTKWYRFSVVTITTIGFGAIYPQTNAGKLLVIPYALIGIPMMMAYLAYIGSVISDWVEEIMMCIHRIVKGNRPIKFKSLKRSFYLFLGMWIVIFLALLDFVFFPALSWLDGIYFFIVTFTTVGFGDITWPAASPTFYSIKLFFGLSIVSALVDSFLDLREKFRWGNRRYKLLCCSYVEEENINDDELADEDQDTQF